MHEPEELKGFEHRLLVELREIVGERAAVPSSSPAPTNRRPSPGFPRRRWALVGAVVAFAAMALVLGPTFVAPEGSRSSAFAVEVLEDGRIHVKIATDFDQGKRLQDELAKAGVEVQVITMRSHPALVGTIEFPQHQLDPDGVERGQGEFWVDPSQFSGTVEVLIHTAPAPGQQWMQAPSVFHPDEPLGGLPCALGGPMSTAMLERYAASVGITSIDWWVLNRDSRDDSVAVQPSDVRPEGDVEHAERVAPDTLRVGVRPQAVIDRQGHAPPPSMNLNIHESPEPPCSPELADRWPDA